MKTLSLKSFIFTLVGSLILVVSILTNNASAKIRAVGVSSNSKFPVTVQSVRGVGKNYVMQPFPTKVGEPLNYCDSATGDEYCGTYISKDNNDYPLGWEIWSNGANRKVVWTAPTRLPVVQYASPFKKFVGRYFDGVAPGFGGEIWYQLFAGNEIKYVAGKNRIYMNENANIVAYSADTFFDSIATEPLKYFFRKYTGTRTDGTVGSRYYESAYPWDAYFYPYESGWVRNSVDHGSSVIKNYDVDDRGYIYMQTWDGFGIARDTGTSIVPVMQDTSGYDYDSPENANILTPFRTAKSGAQNKLFRSPVDMGGPNNGVWSFKADGKYYILTDTGGAQGGYNIFDVTAPLTPEFKASLVTGGHYVNITKTSGVTEDIVVMQKDNSIEIYKGSELASGGGASKTFSNETKSVPGYSNKCEGYMGLATDQVSGKIYSFSCVKEGSKYLVKLNVFSSTNKSDPATYTETKHNLGLELRLYNEVGKFYPVDIKFSNGYLVAHGYSGSGSVVKFWNLKTGVPVELNTNDFLTKYYAKAPEGYAVANTMNGYGGMQLMSYGGKDYFFYSTTSIGDVYELEPSGASTITITPPLSPSQPYIPPTSGACTATLTFNQTNVTYGGSMTETWQVNGADLGQVYGDCGAGETQISSGPQSYTIPNLTKTTTCKVYGKINGVEACSASATVTVGAKPNSEIGGGDADDRNIDYPTQYFASSYTSSDLGSKTLRQGHNGTEIAALQTLLNQDSNASLVVDGRFGRKTRAVVVSYQISHGLSGDGVVGPKTRAVLTR